MATVQSVTMYNNPIPGVGTSRLIAVGTLVTDAATPSSNSATLEFFIEGTGGNAATRAPVSRDDAMALRLLKAMP